MDYFYLIVNFPFIFRFSECKVMCKLKKRINYYWGFNWPLGQSSINRIVKMHDLFILEGAGKRGVAWSFKWSLG